MQEAYCYIIRRKLQCQTKCEMWALLCHSYTLATEVFPCKEKSLVVSSQNDGECRGKVGCKVTGITVCTLDVSKSEANSL